MFRTRTRWLVVFLVLSASAALAQTSPFIPTQRRPPIQRKETEVVVRTRNVELRLEAFDQRVISLPLFAGITVTAARDRQQRTRWGTIWSGRTREPGGSVIIARRGRNLAADIRPGGKARTMYQIRPAGDGVHQIREIDTRRFPPEGPGRVVESKPQNRPMGDSDVCTTDPPDEIDLMIVYTDDARSAAGGTDQIELEALLSVEASNVAYINSDINQRLRLVHLSEINYAEQDNENTDLANLQGTADGQIDNVHTMRDAAGADLVSMLVSTLNGWCGWANIMGTVDSSFDSSAFSLVKWDCGSGNLSFPHELGHNMGARHDWPNDGTNNSPYVYNHGAFNTTPTAPATPWRTIMSYSNANNDCDDVGGCTRIQYFSNPGLNEPVGGDPLGSSTGNQTDNHLTLNNTALTVANFRCTSPSTGNVWMKDTWDDTGLEPDPATASQDMWKSPYIWVRNSQDAALTAQHMHENPNTSSNVFVYVKMHNGAATAANGDLEIYFADAEASLDWPAAWTLIDSVPVSSFAGHSSRVVEAAWTTPASGGHYCLLARYVSASDPMATAEGTNINANVRANNNLVWRNLNIIGGGDMSAAFWITNRTKERMLSSLVFRGQKEKNYFPAGGLTIVLDDELLRIWLAGGGRSRGLKRDGTRFTVVDASASFDSLVLPAGFRGRVFVKFEPAKSMGSTYIVDAVHFRSGASVSAVGGVSYEVHTEEGFKEGTTVQP